MSDACKHGQTMFCTDCFTEATEPPTADRDDLAAILASEYAKHRHHHAEAGTKDSPEGFAASFAEQAVSMVLESDWLRERDASKWAEGVQYMAERCVDEHGISATYRLGDNPYRADRVDAEDTDNTTDRT